MTFILPSITILLFIDTSSVKILLPTPPIIASGGIESYAIFVEFQDKSLLKYTVFSNVDSSLTFSFPLIDRSSATMRV